MNNRLILSLIIQLIGLSTLHAEDHDLGFGIEAESSHKVNKGLNVNIEGEVRTQDGMADVERLAIGAGVDYKITKWLKSDIGYTLLMRNFPERTSSKYQWSQYWSPRHRAYISMAGFYSVTKHLTLSLRERYQYTYETKRYVERHNIDTGDRASDKVEGGDGEHLLRTRLQLKWGRKKSNWSPYANVEILNDLQDAMHLDQTRYTIGIDYKINKSNTIGLSYRFKDKSDRNENKGHLITICYKR